MSLVRNQSGNAGRSISIFHKKKPQYGCSIGGFKNREYKEDVVVLFYPCFEYYFPLFLSMVMYDREF